MDYSFIGDTTEELCARWIEVGAFYPFSRDHNAIGQAPQELYLWDSVAEASRRALGMRYQLLPYLYSLFYEAHTTGSLVSRSLWVNFPEDKIALGIDRQFMLGEYLLISPVLDAGVTTLGVYFPEGNWYNFATRNLSVSSPAGGVTYNINTPLTYTNVHVRGGGILPLQRSAMTTTAGRTTPFTLMVALCPGGQAYGELFWDNGEQIELNEILSASFSAKATLSNGSVKGIINTATYKDAESLYIESIVVMNTNVVPPSTVTLNNVSLSKDQVVTTAGTITFNLGSALKITEPFELIWE